MRPRTIKNEDDIVGVDDSRILDIDGLSSCIRSVVHSQVHVIILTIFFIYYISF